MPMSCHCATSYLERCQYSIIICQYSIICIVAINIIITMRISNYWSAGVITTPHCRSLLLLARSVARRRGRRVRVQQALHASAAAHIARRG